MPTIAVLGSSLPREGDSPYETARQLGREIARREAILLCGGYGGVMEAACRGAREAGGEAVGVVLAGRGDPNRWVTRRITAPALCERLRHLRDAADGWIFLPRGLGTLVELAWIAESIVKQETPARPLVFLGPFWKPTLETIRCEATGAGALALTASIQHAGDPAGAVRLALSGPPSVG